MTVPSEWHSRRSSGCVERGLPLAEVHHLRIRVDQPVNEVEVRHVSDADAVVGESGCAGLFDDVDNLGRKVTDLSQVPADGRIIDPIGVAAQLS